MAHRVSQLMTSDVTTVSETDPLRVAVELIMMKKLRHLPVVGPDDTLTGIITDRDVKRALPSPLDRNADREAIVDDTKVAQIMTRDPFVVSPETSVAEAVQILVERKIGGLPVVTNGKLVGIFTETDALRLLSNLLDASN